MSLHMPNGNTLIRLADAQPQVWKNGGGLTRELLAWPSATDWQVRFSVADVTASGPFSSFEGAHRWFAVLQGDGVRLSVDDQQVQLDVSSPPFDFDGAAQTYCELLGSATLDFNLMLRGATGTLKRIKGNIQVHINATELVAAYAISTDVSTIFGTERTVLKPGELLWREVSSPMDITLQGDHVLWAHICLEQPV